MEDDLALMEKDYSEKNFDQLLKRGNELMRSLKRVRNIDSWSKRRLRNFAKVHSFMGSTSSEKQNFDKARMHHNADLKIGEVVEDTKIQSRALEHLGRTFIFENKHEKALEFFAKRAHLPRTSLETARLFHEIANCFFQLRAYEFAKDAAMVSMKAANEGSHLMFQLQSATLIGVTKVKLQRTDAAFETFEEALKYATIQGDEKASEAIRDAMKQIETRVAMKVRDRWMKKVQESRLKKEKGDDSDKLNQIPEAEKGKESRMGAESASTVCGILSSMKEDDIKAEGDAQAPPADAASTEEEGNDKEEKEEKGKPAETDDNAGSETNRTDRSGFLIAPEGPMDKRQNQDRVVKVDKEKRDPNKQGNKNQPKKTRPKGVASNPSTAQNAQKGNGKGAVTNEKKEEKEQTTKAPLPNRGNRNVAVTSKTKTETTEKTADSKQRKEVAEKTDKAAAVTTAAAASQAKAESAQPSDPNKARDKAEKQEEANQEPANVNGNDNGKNEMNNENQQEVIEKKDGDDDAKKATDVKVDANSKEAANARVDGDVNDKTTDDPDKRAEADNKNNSEEKADEPKPETENNPNAKEEDKPGNPSENAIEKETSKSATNVEVETVKSETVNASDEAASVNAGNQPKASQKPATKKPQPKPKNAEEKTPPPMERRKSERFIGLDPKKVAEYKNKSPKTIPEDVEEKPQPPKPKTERFIGLKPKKEKKPSEEDGQPTKANEGRSPRDPKPDRKAEEGEGREFKETTQVAATSENETKHKNQDTKNDPNVLPAPQGMTVPVVKAPENSPSPRGENTKHKSLDSTKAKSTEPTTTANDGYESNVPDIPMLTINDEVGFVRRDSNASKLSATRPATRMSLADMVKDEPSAPVKDGTKSSREELSALNALVKEAIKHDKKEMKKAQEESAVPPKESPKESPRKASKARTNSIANMMRMEEMRKEAEMKRARRKRFLRNYKASFLLMINSPYSEANNAQGRRLSTDFKQYKRSMSRANLSMAIREDGTYYQSFDEYEAKRGLKFSPRKSVVSDKMLANSEKSKKHQSGRMDSIGVDEDEILGNIEKHLEQQQTEGGASSKQRSSQALRSSEEIRIEAQLAKAARDIRKKERDERRETKRKLEEAERQRRIDEREEKDLRAALATKKTFSNPYDKTPVKIPKLEPRNSLMDEDELKWMAHQERKLLKAKRRERREKELKRQHEDEKNKRKYDATMAKTKGVGSNSSSKQTTPRDPVDPVDTEEAQTSKDVSPRQGEVTPEETPEVVTPEESQPGEEGTPDTAKEDEADGEEADKEAEDGPQKDQEEMEQEPVAMETREEKAEEATERKEPKAEEAEEEAGEEDEEEEPEVDDFDGYNDSDEDDDDMVAVYIEKEVRQMRADYNDGKIKEVLDRGHALLKALRKHPDIVSWSRRRLRWFAAAHTYMGSSNMDKKEFQKAQSHHQADYRIGEALEDTKIQSRALEHLARVSVLNKNTPKALEYLAKRAHLPRTTEQSARLFHEMGNCFFTLGALEYARDAAAESLEAASKGGHPTYVLQSTLLMAVCHSRLKNFAGAQQQFNSALIHARRLNDTNTQEAIEAALQEVEKRRAIMVRDKWKGKVKKGDQAKDKIEENQEREQEQETPEDKPGPSG